ncbi:MAG: hypothetical protein KAH95_14590, partial [Spirochaetales bacterium]|nr:hypothetical protein [Spirochaetales bacterium]
NYLVINSNDTIEVWSDRGLTIQAVLELDTEGRMIQLYTQTPENPSIAFDGNWNFVEFDRQGDILREVFEDQSWKWDGFMDRVDKLPVFTYKNNFEDNNPGRVHNIQHELDEEEWQIIEEPNAASNRVIAPVTADANSDAGIFLHPGKNFSIEFDIKRLKQSDNTETCWMALDFDMYTSPGISKSFWLSSSKIDYITFGDRSGDFPEQSYNIAMKWDTWHTLKVTVRDGKYFEFFLDGDLFGEREIEEALFTGFKIEGNPVTGVWYMDNLNITWNEVD